MLFPAGFISRRPYIVIVVYDVILWWQNIYTTQES